jgi:hypothetical protein
MVAASELDDLGKGELVRLLPDEPFPSYAFIPGRHPHPTSDPAGHSYSVPPPSPPALDPEEWQTNRAYLYGIDLFNAGYYWESHVQFEALWLAAGRRGVLADFLKGLIRVAAAGVKHLEGRPQGVRSHACRAVALWRGVTHALSASQCVFLGLRLATLLDLAESVCRSGWPATPPRILPETTT